MGTRSGDIDPAIVNIVASKERLAVSEVETLLNTQSGLLGISGLTNDMRERQQSGDRRARLAIEVFCYRTRKYIGAYLAAMGGADAVIFSGGIGENSPEIRAGICEGLEWAGLALDREANRRAVGIEGRSVRNDRDNRLLHTDRRGTAHRDTVRCILGEPHPS